MKAVAIFVVLAAFVCASLAERGYIAVANRGAGTLTIIDTVTDEILHNINVTSPQATKPAEPMYPVVVGDYITVGDRANRHISYFDMKDNFKWIADVPAGAGIFHHIVNNRGDRIWVCNDIDNTWTVIDAVRREVITTINMPADLASQTGAQTHDVVFSPDDRYAYVTVQNLPGFTDVVLMYSTENYTELARQDVGKLPHVTVMNYITAKGKKFPLFVPSQKSLIDSLMILDPETLDVIQSIPGIDGAHMCNGPSADGKTFYVTNLPGGGLNGLFAFDSQKMEVIVEATVDVPHTTPHNLQLTSDGKKLYLTHSGTNTQVTVWRVSSSDPRPRLLREIITGLNAYGIWYFETDLDLGAKDTSAAFGLSSNPLVVLVAMFFVVVLASVISLL